MMMFHNMAGHIYRESTDYKTQGRRSYKIWVAKYITKIYLYEENLSSYGVIVNIRGEQLKTIN